MALFKKSQPNKIQIKAEQTRSSEEKLPRISVSVQRPSALLVKHPWITEKSGRIADSGKYVFIVDKKANKPIIAEAVESIYNVKVLSVNIINKKSKIKSLGRAKGKIPGYKKAIVQLKEGQKIDVMPA